MANCLKMVVSIILFLGVWPISSAAKEDAGAVMLDGTTGLPDLSGKIFFARLKSAPDTLPGLVNENIYTRAETSRLNFGYTPNTLVLKISYRNISPHKLLYYLEIESLIDRIEFVQVENNQVIKTKITGRKYPLKTRDLSHRNFIMTFEAKSQSNGEIILGLNSEGAMLIPMILYTPEAFLSKDHEQQLFFGLYFGLMIVMVLYNLFLFFSVKDRTYLYYVVYITFFILFQAGLFGFSNEYLYASFPEFANRLLPLSVYGSILFQLMFARGFLAIALHLPVWDKVTLGIMAFSTLGILSSFFAPYRPLITTGIIMGMISALLIMTISVRLYIRKYKPARFFILAFGFLALGVIIIGLRNLGLLPFNYLTGHSAQLGSALEVILLSLALGDRINILKKEKDQTREQALQREKEMTGAFSRFVPDQFLSLLEKPDFTSMRLGDSTEKEMSIFFSDIRDFTSLSEIMTPDQNFKFLNAYLKRVGPIFRKHNGFIDKYIGDAVMALFPEKPADAVMCAIEMNHVLRQYNIERQRAGYAPVITGTGIHTGNLKIGMIGENERWDGTVIGDSVNLASRLEGLTKSFGVPVIVSQAVIEKIPPSIAEVRFLDQVQIKGKKDKVTVYEVLNAYEKEKYERIKSYKDKFQLACTEFQVGKLKNARSLFQELHKKYADDPVITYYLDKLNS